MEHFISGAQLDTRSKVEKSKDYKFEEIVAFANPVQWVEKTPDQWRKFPIFNQNGSGSCVAQTQAKEMGIMRYLKDGNYVHFSAADIYQKRFGKPVAGMGAIEARNIAKNGVTLEILAPSQALSDSEMDSLVIEDYKHEVGNVFSVTNYIELPIGNIEILASFIQTTGKGAMVWFFFEYKEWTDHPYVYNKDLMVTDPGICRHSVTAVDFCLVNGKKSIIIEDSWGPNYGLNGQRVIDEEFFKTRNFYAGYLMNFKFDEQIVKPHYIFLKDLELGMLGADVTMLQTCLQYEKLFPTNVKPTQYFGSITRKAVQDFQTKYSIAFDGMLGYGRVGPKTRAKLNEIFG